MNTYTDTTHNDSNAVAHSLSQQQSNGSITFLDNRPETAAQRKMQEAISNSILSKPVQLFGFDAGHTYLTSALLNPVCSETENVLQRTMQVGTDIYSPRKKGLGIKDLINLVETNSGGIGLIFGWKAKLRNYINEMVVEPRPFTDIDDLVDYLTKKTKKKKTTSEKNQEQDLRIQGLNTGYGAKELEFGKMLSYESGKAFGNFTGQIEKMPEFTDTGMELEDIDPGLRSTTNDFTKSNNPFINLHSLGQSDLHRLDFMAPNNVEINTQGYSSMKDRSVDPHTLSTSFGFGTVKVGPDVSSYMKEMKTGSKPDEDQMSYLNSLEMHRFPGLSPQTGMKRELYNQDEFSKEQGMGYNHDHSSVEFVGAISGSSLTKPQLENMRRQQNLSNYAILETAYTICPDVKLGKALKKGKHIPTPKEEMDALKKFIAVAEDVKSTQEEKDNAKRALRKVLTQVLRGVTQIEEIDSDDDINYPPSPYNAMDYQ
ncbi:MAG: hypothetical protein ABIQ40_00755 [Bacteroidia bacterium]